MKSLSRRSLTMAAGVLLTWGIVCALEVPPLRGRINDFAGSDQPFGEPAV
jgi:hypothetical protein